MTNLLPQLLGDDRWLADEFFIWFCTNNPDINFIDLAEHHRLLEEYFDEQDVRPLDKIELRWRFDTHLNTRYISKCKAVIILDNLIIDEVLWYRFLWLSDDKTLVWDEIQYFA